MHSLALCCLCDTKVAEEERAVCCFPQGRWMLLVGGSHSPMVLKLLFPVISAPRFLWSQHGFSNEPHIQESKAPAVPSTLRGTAATERQTSRLSRKRLVSGSHSYCCSYLRLGIWSPTIRLVFFFNILSSIAIFLLCMLIYITMHFPCFFIFNYMCHHVVFRLTI